MGSDAELWVFDHRRFVGELVPRWVEALRDGAPVQASRLPGLDAIEEDWWPSWARADLVRDCTHLDPRDLAHRAPIPETASSRDHWPERACARTDCPSGASCPYQLARSSAASDFNYVLEGLIATHCVGESQFLGRNFTPASYAALTGELGASDEARGLLHALGTRGRTVGYAFANGDGIHGWLDPEETRALHRALDRLDLPRHPDTCEAMLAYRQPSGAPWGGLHYVPPDGVTWPALSLSFVRTVAAIAIARGHGVLWANDLVRPE